MHELEPFYGWQKYYNSVDDHLCPFYGKEHSEFYYSDKIYNYFIHPQWDFMGSETLYIKIIYANYVQQAAIIEFIGEWNDAINNDIMHLKRNIIDHLIEQHINKFILIGENVYMFHQSDDCYYEEWFDDVEDGWIAALNFQEHVIEDWQKANLDFYVNFGGDLDSLNWRTLKPHLLVEKVNNSLQRRLSLPA